MALPAGDLNPILSYPHTPVFDERREEPSGVSLNLILSIIVGLFKLTLYAARLASYRTAPSGFVSVGVGIVLGQFAQGRGALAGMAPPGATRCTASDLQNKPRAGVRSEPYSRPY